MYSYEDHSLAIMLLHFKQWCVEEESEGLKEPWFVVLADFCGVNAHTMADFKLLVKSLSEHGVAEMWINGSCNPLQASSSIYHFFKTRLISLCFCVDPETIVRFLQWLFCYIHYTCTNINRYIHTKRMLYLCMYVCMCMYVCVLMFVCI